MPSHEAAYPKEGHALTAALRLLTYRARSEAELRQRLHQRFSPKEIEAAIQKLKSQGYLNDAAFARSWRENRERHRPRSARLIRNELAHRGVSSETISEALEGFDDEENALRAAQKLLPSLRGADYPKFARRLGTYLQRRGFALSLVREIVHRLWAESAHPLDSDIEGEQQE